MWEEFKKTEGAELKVWEVGKIIGQKWRELNEEDKQVSREGWVTFVMAAFHG